MSSDPRAPIAGGESRKTTARGRSLLQERASRRRCRRALAWRAVYGAGMCRGNRSARRENEVPEIFVFVVFCSRLARSPAALLLLGVVALVAATAQLPDCGATTRALR
ncbi:unnamed protein product [Lampetra planeri]